MTYFMQEWPFSGYWSFQLKAFYAANVVEIVPLHGDSPGN
jgi:hypothetical protein